jgi:hypothetical protein
MTNPIEKYPFATFVFAIIGISATTTLLVLDLGRCWAANSGNKVKGPIQREQVVEQVIPISIPAGSRLTEVVDGRFTVAITPDGTRIRLSTMKRPN